MDARDNFNGSGFSHRFGQPGGNDNTNGGRKPSIKNALKRLLKADGKLLIPKAQVIKINDDGGVVIKIPTDEGLALKLISIASSNSNRALDAIKLGMEQLDGKPRQSFDFDYKEVKPLETVRLDPRKVKDEQKN